MQRTSIGLSIFILSLAAGVLGFQNCSGGGGGGGGDGTTSINSIPQHLYVTNALSPGQIYQYDLPLTTPPSAPSVKVQTADTSNSVGIAIDPSGNVVIGDYFGNIKYFQGPLTDSSTASAVFVNGTSSSLGGLAFGPNGVLFAATASNKINVFTPPFDNTSAPSLVISDPSLSATTGIAVDSNGNIYVSNVGGGGSNIVVLAPPYTGTPTVSPIINGAAYRRLAVYGSQLFVPAVGGSGYIDVYNLPITSASAPAFTITSGLNGPETIAFDASGNMYVGNAADGVVHVFAPPFSSSSTYFAVLPAIGSIEVFALAVGL